MKKLYIDALQNLKSTEKPLYPPFSTSWTYLEPVTSEGEKSALKDEEVLQKSNTEKITEKKEVLESFTGYAQEELNQKEKISFKGGEVKQKLLDFSFELENINENELIALSHDLLGEEFTKIHFQDKKQEQIKVLFVSDSYLNYGEENTDIPSQYHLCFDDQVSQLFAKMVKAMGLEDEQVLMSALSDEENEKNYEQLLFGELAVYKPQFIVSLGAQSTSFFIGNDKKLRNHHGQLFQLNFTQQDAIIYSASMMPLFSPKLLNIAPNMKKTAWEDMQKLMQKF